MDIYSLGIVFLELLCAFPTEQERVDTLNKLKGLGFCDAFADEPSCDVSWELLIGWKYLHISDISGVPYHRPSLDRYV